MIGKFSSLSTTSSVSSSSPDKSSRPRVKNENRVPWLPNKTHHSSSSSTNSSSDISLGSSSLSSVYSSSSRINRTTGIRTSSDHASSSLFKVQQQIDAARKDIGKNSESSLTGNSSESKEV